MTHVEFFKILKILPLSAQYIYSLLMFVINNRNLFLDNQELYRMKKKYSYNLHPPLSHLTKYCTKKEYIMHVLGSSIIYHLP